MTMNSPLSVMRRHPIIRSPDCVLYAALWKRYGTVWDSARGVTATVTGATWTYQGRDFSGVNQKISVAHNAVFNVTTGNFTLECWMKADGLGAGGRVLMAKSVAGGNAEGIVFNVGGDERLFCRVRQDAGNYTTLDTGTGTVLVINTWYHLVFLRTGTTLKAYINSVEDAGLTQTDVGVGGASNPDNGQPLLLGLLIDNTQDFDGIIGEARMYKRALTPFEIIHNYNASRWRYLKGM